MSDSPQNNSPQNASPDTPATFDHAVKTPPVNGYALGSADSGTSTGNDHLSSPQAAITTLDNAIPAQGRASWIASLLARRRSPHGDILPYSFSYEVPLVDEVPLNQTAYANALQLLEARDPERAHSLRAFYDRRLLTSLRCLRDARAEAENKLSRDLAEARRINREVETQQQRLQGECENALSPFEPVRETCEERLSKAHQEAAQAMARCGKPYDPENPDASSVLRHEREPLEAIAGDLNEPWTPGDGAMRLPKSATFALTALTGCVLGLSLGLMGEFYATDELAARVWVVLAFCLGGVGVATLTGEGIKLSFKAVSERLYRNQPRAHWWWLLMASIAISGLIVMIDSYIERSGLMSKVFEAQAMQSLNHNGVQTGVPLWESVMFFCAGMILSLPLVLCYGWHGYLDGRYHACRNRLIAEQEQRFTTRSQWLREDEATQNALDAVSRVRDALRHEETLAKRLAQAARPFEREMALWESKRLPEVREFDIETKHRLQDLLANVLGAQIEWDRAMDMVRGVPLWHLSFWQRLRLLLGLNPYPSRVEKLPRNRT